MRDKDLYKKIFLDIESENTFKEDDSDLLEHNYQTISYLLKIYDSNGTKRNEIYNPSLEIEPTMVPDYDFSEYILELIEPIFKKCIREYIECLQEENYHEGKIHEIKKQLESFYGWIEDDLYQELVM